SACCPGRWWWGCTSLPRWRGVRARRKGVDMSDASVVTTYHEAWTRGDMATARSCLADDLDFQGPIDTFCSADEFIDATALRQLQAGSAARLASFRSAPLPFDCFDQRGQCRVHRGLHAHARPLPRHRPIDDVDLADPVRLVVEQRRGLGVGHARAER